ncbi:Gfo/Idh/MocA family protein [Pseudorhodobacter ferrugineus]|uniref:Gfo/Idh/MocA family protein n=1 Tax=Pseudorhodobacter ferrugineus TaxID=77008 RepID=UPI0003B69CCB|nr:Gfo/Idh/MocA family oxidoreductase [Pseudorhodobacter ferrugineus]
MTVRIAVVGAGLIGLRHIATIGAASGADLACVVDPDAGARGVAVAQGVPWFAGLEDVPEGLADGVILATPNRLHVAGGLDCVARGLPVLVEKPIATDVAEARILVEAAEAAGVAVLVGHHRRHNPLIAAAKAMIDAGRIGPVISVQAQFWLCKPDEYFDVAWRREAGAGPVFVNLIHDVDLLRHLVGDVVAVQARIASHRGHAVEDTCVATLEFANGALGTVNISDTIPAPWSWELTSGENPAYPPTDQACYMIGGRDGALELPRLRIWQHEGAHSWWAPIAATTHSRGHGDPLVLQIEQFARVIRGEEPPLVPAREGMRTLAVIEAILASSAQGVRVELG